MIGRPTVQGRVLATRPARMRAGSLAYPYTGQPGVQILLGLFALHTVTFLQLPEELVFFTCDDLQIVVGQLAIIDSTCLLLRSNS